MLTTNGGGNDKNRRHFAQRIADVFGLDKNLINPFKMADINWLAREPRDSSLNVLRISKYKKPYSIEEIVKLFLEESERFSQK